MTFTYASSSLVRDAMEKNFSRYYTEGVKVVLDTFYLVLDNLDKVRGDRRARSSTSNSCDESVPPPIKKVELRLQKGLVYTKPQELVTSQDPCLH